MTKKAQIMMNGGTVFTIFIVGIILGAVLMYMALS